MARSLRIGLLSAFFAAHLAGAAEAQPRDEDASLRRAVVLFEESERLYNQGEFDEAATLLRRAHELRPDPVLLFNLARALEGAGDLDGAIEAYEGYLEGQPEAEDRGAIEQRLRTLRAQRDRLAQAGEDGEDAEDVRADVFDDAPPEATGGASPLPWIVAGAGGAVLLTGAILGVTSQSKDDEAQATRVQRDADALHGEAQTLATLANVSFVLGGLLAAGGIGWGVLSLASDDEGASEESTALSIGPTGLALRGRF